MLPPFGKKYKTIHYKNKQRSIEISGINAEKVLRLGILAELQKASWRGRPRFKMVLTEHANFLLP